MKILIDPYVIVVPSTFSPPQRVSSYVEGMETWIGAASIPSVNILYSSHCFGSLMENGRFPFANKLAHLFSTTGIVQYDAQTVSKLFMRLFNSWKNIEDLLRIASIAGKLDVTPASFVDRISNDTSRQFVDCLGKVALEQEAPTTEFAEFTIGSTDSDADGTVTKLAVNGVITQLEVQHGVRADKIVSNLPATVNCEFSVLLSREQVLRFIDWTIIWKFPAWAIEKAYYSAVPSSDRATHVLSSFDVGNRFIDTIIGLSLHTQAGRLRSIYETCALVICGYASQLRGINSRSLRGSVRGDGAKGMRADISQEQAGYRLHYWKRRNGTVELSCVNVHNDVTIY